MTKARRIRDASQLAREHTELAIGTLADAAANAFKDSDRIAAANSLLDRGHGRAVSAVIQVPMSRQVAEQLARMSDEDLMRVIEAEPLPGALEADSAQPALMQLAHDRDPLLE